jgi:hypothetical protein
LTEWNEPTCVEDYLEAYAKDETGLRNHGFSQNVDSGDKCAICEDLKQEHHDFSLCQVCCIMVKADDLFCMQNCKHTYCRECWQANIQSKLNTGDLMRIKCLDYCCQEQCSEQIIRSILNV